MNINIITERAGFPNGYGATTIIKNYGIGFIRNGHRVSVSLLRPSETKSNPLNISRKGVDKGIAFNYLCGTQISPKTKICRIFLYLYAYLVMTFQFLVNTHPYDVVIVYSPDHLLTVRLISILCRISKSRLIGIKTESSIVDYDRIKRKNWIINETKILNHFKKLVVISHHLKRQVVDFGYTGLIKVLPIIINEDLLALPSQSMVNKKEISYIGNLNNINEIMFLLEGSSIFILNNRDWRLNVYGTTSNEQIMEAYRQLVNRLGTQDHVFFMGHYSTEALRDALRDGAVNVLPRLQGEHSQAGFPMKLTDYLLSGKPTLVSNTGEIPLFLIDRRDILYHTPGDMGNFVEMLNYIITNYNEATKVAENGKKTALMLFGSRHITEEILSWEEICRR